MVFWREVLYIPGGRMRKKLSLPVVLLLVGAYAAYAVSQPKPPRS
ncbi:hypothetical protein ADU37_CDS04080 [Thermococcus sp. 2319x1]|nr:hypothetical protein ADU37_CDS04080 [Thermococcus sp. 2319x1]